MVASRPRTPEPYRCREFWRRLVIILLAIAATVPVVMKSRPRVMDPPLAAFSAVSSAPGLVRISGDVRHPGIYPTTANTMTGGVILLAEPIRRPQRYVPAGSEAVLLQSGADLRVMIDADGTARVTAGSLPTAQRLALGIPLDINNMTESDFDRVPGIGPVLARRIVEYRQSNGGFMMPQDLLTIEGIGQKKYLRLQRFFN